jgi:hypothetical protein
VYQEEQVELAAVEQEQMTQQQLQEQLTLEAVEVE